MSPTGDAAIGTIPAPGARPGPGVGPVVAVCLSFCSASLLLARKGALP